MSSFHCCYFLVDLPYIHFVNECPTTSVMYRAWEAYHLEHMVSLLFVFLFERLCCLIFCMDKKNLIILGTQITHKPVLVQAKFMIPMTWGKSCGLFRKRLIVLEAYFNGHLNSLNPYSIGQKFNWILYFQ